LTEESEIYFLCLILTDRADQAVTVMRIYLLIDVQESLYN